MRAVLSILTATMLLANSASAEPYCAYYLPEGWEDDVPEGHIPFFSQVFEDDTTFEEGGKIFQGGVIGLSSRPGNGVTLEEGYLALGEHFIYDETMIGDRATVEQLVNQTMCPTPAVGM